MAQVSVTWDSVNNKPAAPDVTVTRGQSNQNITWVPTGLTITSITKPSDGVPAHDDFSTPSTVGQSANWQCLDSNADPGNYEYTICGTSTAGVSGCLDPVIRNPGPDK